MKYIILVLFINFICVSKGFAQFYTPAEIEQIQLNKSASEGDFYLDTMNNQYYIGLTHGVITEIGLDSVRVSQTLSSLLLNENDLESNSLHKGVTQRSIKHYVDSLTQRTQISNELFFDGKSHENSIYHSYYYVSMKENLGYCVVRYNKNDINDEAKAESSTDPQPLTLNDVVGLTYN